MEENEIEKWKISKTFWNLFDMWEYQVSDARNKINGVLLEVPLFLSIFNMTPRWKTVVLVAEKHEFENRYESIMKAPFGSFDSSRFWRKKNRKTIFQSNFPTKMKRFLSHFDGRVKPGFIDLQEFDCRDNSKLKALSGIHGLSRFSFKDPSKRFPNRLLK